MAEKEEEDVSILCWDMFTCCVNNTVCNSFKLKQIMNNSWVWSSDRMISTQQSQSTQRKICPDATLSTTICCWSVNAGTPFLKTLSSPQGSSIPTSLTVAENFHRKRRLQHDRSCIYVCPVTLWSYHIYDGHNIFL